MANVKISELPPAGPLTGEEILAMVQNGVTVQEVLSRVLGFLFSEIPERTNNTAALDAGMEPGMIYNLPVCNDAYRLAIVRPSPYNFDVTADWANMGGGLTPVTDQASFEAFIDGTVSLFALVGNRLLAYIDSSAATALGLQSSSLSFIRKFGGLNSIANLELENNNLTSLEGSILPVSLENLGLELNQLTEFDASTLTNLQVLELGGNQLATFDCSTLPESITELYIYSNQLTSFNPTGLTSELTSLALLDNQLAVSEINNILIHLDVLGLGTGVNIELQSQTPAATPTGAGATAKANLISRGATVTTD